MDTKFDYSDTSFVTMAGSDWTPLLREECFVHNNAEMSGQSSSPSSSLHPAAAVGAIASLTLLVATTFVSGIASLGQPLSQTTPHNELDA